MYSLDFIAKASYFFLILSILPFFQIFIKKEDLNWDKSAFLVLLFTAIGFVTIKAHPIYDKYGFADPLTLFIFLLFPIASLVGIYLVKTSAFKKNK